MKNFYLLLILFFGINIQSFSQCLPVADYPFTTNALDVSGNNYDGVVNGAALTTDRWSTTNRAYLFDGGNDYIELNNNIPIITTSQFTVAVWAKMTGIGGGGSPQNILFIQRDDASGSSIILLAETNLNKAAFGVRPSGGFDERPEFTAMPYGNWHHYAGVLDADSVRLYIDGVQVDAVPFTQIGSFTVSIDYVFIGRHSCCGGANPGFFNGAIDDVKIYNCALDSNEIQTLYTSVSEKIVEDNNVTVYPNPFSTTTLLEFNNEHQEAYALTLYNAFGQTVQHIDNITTSQVAIERKHLKGGLYFYSLQSQDEVINGGKVIIQ